MVKYLCSLVLARFSMCLLEFNAVNFGFNGGVNRIAFHQSEWTMLPHAIFVIFRVLCACYVFGWNIAIHTTRHQFTNPPVVYLTQWTYILLANYLLCALCVVLAQCRPQCCRRFREVEVNAEVKGSTLPLYSPGHPVSAQDQCDNVTRVHEAQNKSDCLELEMPSFEKASTSSAIELSPVDQMPASYYSHMTSSTREPAPSASSPHQALNMGMRLCWFLHATSANLSLLTTLVVYLLIFPLTNDLRGITSDMVSINTHAINSILVLIDLFLVGFPVRLLHAVYPAAIGVIYLVFSVLYWKADPVNHVLYPILDWSNPGLAGAVSAVLIIIVVPLVQLLLYGLYRLRYWCTSSCRLCSD